MNLLMIIYTIFIKPLELIFELIFVIANRIVVNPGIAIIALSLTVNFLVLPLYRQADKMQEEERRTEEKLHGWVTHIKKTFRGDERFMMLQAYYRENNYKPYYALRGSLSLLLEIPFFIAAYRFLSGLSLLQGISFGPIADLGAPDSLIRIGAFSINVLPVLMTLINIISGAVYTKGAPLKSKIQLYGMALIFLVFLYRSPSGLVFYWTLNNLFSLAKNIFYKLKDPVRVLKNLASVSGILLAMYFVIKSDYSVKSRLFFVVAGLMLQIPLLWRFLPFKTCKSRGKKNSGILPFILPALFLAVLTGILIPSAVIGSSPTEFVNITKMENPVRYVVSAACLGIGFFMIWMGVFYYLSEEKGKEVFSTILWILVPVFSVNYLFFGTDLGTISPALKFDRQPDFSFREMMINLAIMIGITFICLLIKEKWRLVILSAGIVSMLVMGGTNIYKTFKEFSEISALTIQNGGGIDLKLSRNKQNVVVIMMDRMFGYYLPFIMNEKPELYDTLDGFTYYSNAISFSNHTNTGSSAIFGGYEYSPEEMNRRDTELLVDKHNESLRVMPVLFSENGFDVSVCDPSLANYQKIPDLSIYDDYPNIKSFILEGRGDSGFVNAGDQERLLNRNLFCYSLMKCVPCFIQRYVYDRGLYNSSEVYTESKNAEGQVQDGVSIAAGLDPDFMEAYYVLDNLSELIKIQNTEENVFLMMTNNTAHEPCLLQEPEYVPSVQVDNTDYDKEHQFRTTSDERQIELKPEDVWWDAGVYDRLSHYEVNAAALIELGKWADHLRQEGVYDNTRIIVVSDHGFDLGFEKDLCMEIPEGHYKTYDMLFFNGILLEKDFNSRGFRTDDTFMTNADVPSLATKDLIKDPRNPFTGNKIDDSPKKQGPVRLFYSYMADADKKATRFQEDVWFSVHDDILDPKNWEFVGIY